jgi:hypothetical protein
MSEFRILDYNYAFDPSVTITATSEDPNFPASNLKRYQRSRVWRSSGIASIERIVFDLQTAEQIDSFAMLFNPIQGEGVKFSDSAVIKLQANATNSWGSPALEVTLSIDSAYDVITYFFATPQSYRFWAVQIQDAGNAFGYLEIPKIILSKSTQLGQTPEIGFSDVLTDQSKISDTPYGHRYSDVYPERRSFQFDYSALAMEDVEALQQIFRRVGKVTPIALALDPTETLFDKDRFFLYGYLNDKLQGKHRFYSYFDGALSLEEAL